MAKNTQSSNEKQIAQTSGYLVGLTRIYIILVTAVYPLYVGTSGYDDIVHSKSKMFWAFSITYLILFALFYIVYYFGLKPQDRPNPFRETFSIADWAVLAFMACVTISCLLSEYKNKVFLGMANRNDGWLTYFCMVAVFFTVSRWYRPKQTDFMIFAAGSGLVCIYGYFQFHNMDFLNFFPYTRDFYTSGGEPLYSGVNLLYRTTLGNIDFVSAYVCMSIIVFAFLYLKCDGKARFLYLCVSIMNFALMVIADADAGRVAVLGTMLLMIPVYLSSVKALGKVFILLSGFGFSYFLHYSVIKHVMIPSWGHEPALSQHIFLQSFTYPSFNNILAALSALLLVAGTVIILRCQKIEIKKAVLVKVNIALLAVLMLGGITVVEVAGRNLPETHTIHQARELLHGNLDDSFGSNRMFIWKRALAKVPEHPIFGTGSDTFLEAFGKANQDEAKQLHSVVYDKAHNDFIQILICNGILALAAYLIFIVALVVASIKGAFGDLWLLVALGGSLAYIIQSFFGIDTVIVTPIYWILLGMTRGRQLEAAQNHPLT